MSEREIQEVEFFADEKIGIKKLSPKVKEALEGMFNPLQLVHLVEIVNLISENILYYNIARIINFIKVIYVTILDNNKNFSLTW